MDRQQIERAWRKFFDKILLSGRAGQRHINETKFPTDVWVKIAIESTAARDDASKAIESTTALENVLIDLILTPVPQVHASILAKELIERFEQEGERTRQAGSPDIIAMEGFVAAKFNLISIVRIVLPVMGFNFPDMVSRLASLVQQSTQSQAGPTLKDALGLLGDPAGADARTMPKIGLKPDLRFALLILILAQAKNGALPDAESLRWQPVQQSIDELARLLELSLDRPILVVAKTAGLLERPAKAQFGVAKIVKASINRSVDMLSASVRTIKADAAKRVFDISCSELTWAVIDSGIDGAHPAFRDHSEAGYRSRVLKAYDFSILRELASWKPGNQLASTSFSPLPEIDERIRERALRNGVDLARLRQVQRQIVEDVRFGRTLDWGNLSKLIEVPIDELGAPEEDQPNGHGTHVAGILAGDWREDGQELFRGVCPDLKLYDLRTLSRSREHMEFAVIAALEFVRWLNSRNKFPIIHGVNISLGFEHDKREYACGQTPVCQACTETVRSGVVVVAAAGNAGSQDFQTQSGVYSGYSVASITDPGNTQDVITVGSTHRERPHEFGVSYFSSRGPTGDGRKKPDLVAPGEKIEGPLPHLGYGRLDGTSMAAPHVSGAAALLMARNAELTGEPARIKQILMDTATDLGRDKDFQGRGLLDILRALQSV